MKDTLEGRTADTILQSPIEVVVGGENYMVAPPSIATLVLVSKEISTLPDVELADSDRVMQDVLFIAKDCTSIGNIAAILILGAKGCKKVKRQRTRVKSYNLFNWIKFNRKEIVEDEIDLKEELARKIMEEMTPREIHNLMAQIFQQMQIGDFFGLTTFLTEVNLTKKTKVDAATVSGQS